MFAGDRVIGARGHPVRPTGLFGNRTVRCALLLLGLALAVRVIFWAEWNRAGLLALPVVDADTYDREARGLLEGSWPEAEPFWQAPAYSLFLGGLYRVVGHSWALARLANALLGVGICLLVWFLARKYLTQRQSLIAFGICALNGSLIYFEGQLLRETLSAFLLLVWLIVQLRAMHSFDLMDQEVHVSAHAKWWWLLSGCLLGLAALCRENSLILAPLVVGWGLLRLSRARRLLLPAIFTIGLVLAIAPVTLYNYSRERSFILISSGSGVNFFLGNNPNSRQTIAIRPGRFWDRLVDEPRREAGARTAAERSAFFYKKAFGWALHHPFDYLHNTLYKTIGLASAHEIKRNQDIYEAREGSVILRLLLWRAGPFGFPFGLLGPAALLGIYLIARGFWVGRTAGSGRDLRFIACVVGAYGLGIVLFFPTARYRVPLLPILCLFAAVGAGGFVQSLRGGRGQGRSRRVLVEFFAVLVVAFVWVDGGWVRAREDPADQAFLRGTALGRAGRTDEALEQLRRATQSNPRQGEAWTATAALCGKSGRREEATAAALAALAIDSTDAQAWVDLGMTRLDAGDLAGANRDLRHALSFEPDLPEAWLNLGTVQLREGETDGAEQSYRRALDSEPNLVEARCNLAQQLGRRGAFAEGRSLLREGLRRAPCEGRLWFALGNLEGRAGRWEEAIRAFREAVARMPQNADAWNNLGLVLAQVGRTGEALHAFDRALQINPAHPQAAGNRRRYGTAGDSR